MARIVRLAVTSTVTATLTLGVLVGVPAVAVTQLGGWAEGTLIAGPPHCCP